MSVPEVDAARSGVTPARPAGRRIRQDARDGLSVAAFSLGASVGLSGLVWVLLHWLA